MNRSTGTFVRVSVRPEGQKMSMRSTLSAGGAQYQSR